MDSSEQTALKMRPASEKDVPLILSLIRELAEYEKMLDLVEATEENLRDSLFIRHAAEAVIAEYDGRAVGYMIFFHNFSTFTGRPGIFLEDIFVKPEMRGRGFGSQMLDYLAKLAADRKCVRVDWCCLDWNEPSKRFYRGIGAEELGEWRIFRLHKEPLAALGGKTE